MWCVNARLAAWLGCGTPLHVKCFRARRSAGRQSRPVPADTFTSESGQDEDLRDWMEEVLSWLMRSSQSQNKHTLGVYPIFTVITLLC